MSKQKISVFTEVYNKHYFSGLYNLRDKDQIELCIFSYSLIQILIYVLKQFKFSMICTKSSISSKVKWFFSSPRGKTDIFIITIS
jgi:hypothetical protein